MRIKKNKAQNYLKFLSDKSMIEFVDSVGFIGANSTNFTKMKDYISLEGMDNKGKSAYKAKFYPYYCEVSGKTVKGEIKEMTYTSTYGNYISGLIAKASILGDTKIKSAQYDKDYNEYHEKVVNDTEQASLDAVNELNKLNLIEKSEGDNLIKKLAERKARERSERLIR